MKTIQTSIIIDAPVKNVWDTLMDFEQQPQWNPFIQEISGAPSVGSQLTVSIAPPNGKGMTFRPLVVTHDPFKAFSWRGKLGIRGLFDGEHFFRLEPIGDQSTRFIHGEHFSGLLVPLFGKMLEQTRAGFMQMNEALKLESEKQWISQQSADAV